MLPSDVLLFVTSNPVRPHPQVICRQVGGGAVLIHLDTNQIYELNSTGHRVWELLAAGFDADAIRERLSTELDVEADRADREISAILTDLSNAHLVVHA